MTANETIAVICTAITTVGGALVGLYFLLRSRLQKLKESDLKLKDAEMKLKQAGLDADLIHEKQIRKDLRDDAYELVDKMREQLDMQRKEIDEIKIEHRASIKQCEDRERETNIRMMRAENQMIRAIEYIRIMWPHIQSIKGVKLPPFQEEWGSKVHAPLPAPANNEEASDE